MDANRCYIVFVQYPDRDIFAKVFMNKNSAIDFCNRQNEDDSDLISYFFEEHELND